MHLPSHAHTYPASTTHAPCAHGVLTTPGFYACVCHQRRFIPGIIDIGGKGEAIVGAMGSLSTVDPLHHILYYLGGASDGTTLVGVDLATAATVCTGLLPLKEMSYVGVGQSISWESSCDGLGSSSGGRSGGDGGSGGGGGGCGGLLITGVIEVNVAYVAGSRQPPRTSTLTHSVLRTKGCGANGTIAPVRQVGVFGDAGSDPVLHASAFDSKNERLFVRIGTSVATSDPTAAGIGIVSLRRSKGGGRDSKDSTAKQASPFGGTVVSTLPFVAIPFDSPAQLNMVGLQYDGAGSLLSVVQNSSTGGLDLIGLAVNTSADEPSSWTWAWAHSSLPRQRYEWLYGNIGAVSAFDTLTRTFYVLAGERPSGPGIFPPMHLVGVDVGAGKVTSSPLVAGLPLGVDSLYSMNFVAKTSQQGRELKKWGRG